MGQRVGRNKQVTGHLVSDWDLAYWRTLGDSAEFTADLSYPLVRDPGVPQYFPQLSITLSSEVRPPCLPFLAPLSCPVECSICSHSRKSLQGSHSFLQHQPYRQLVWGQWVPSHSSQVLAAAATLRTCLGIISVVSGGATVWTQLAWILVCAFDLCVP